ncbi:MAG: deoxyribonuclease II family protein [Limnohabitans sp.]|nr:deoxyribonuclease II family protein [Limnohabitans sp.]
MTNKQTEFVLSTMDDNGQAVDWWFLYKVAKKSTASDGSKPTGTEYVYFDSNSPAKSKLVLSENLISDITKGCVATTLNQIYNNLNDPDLGWFFYNDEDPITDKTNSSRGHTKGVLAFNTKTDSAFWLVHSTPKFPPQTTYSYPDTAVGNAQSFLCITLKDVATAKAIASQFYVAQQPNVYLASELPNGVQENDQSLGSLLKNQVTSDKTAYANFITFSSKAGQSFRCIAKNKYWNTEGDDDFYNDLVGPALNECLEVETWEHYKEPGSEEAGGTHEIQAMKSVNLKPMNTNPSYDWSEENDHAKIAISAESEDPKYVCVGDLNFTVAQENRSGGTVAFINNDLWQNLFDILSSEKV